MSQLQRKLNIAQPWSSIVEGDEQIDWPKSQTSMEFYRAWTA